MAKFIYKMESILSVKYKLEDQAKNAFAEANMVLNQEEEKLARLHVRKENYENQLYGQVSGSLKIMEIRRMEEAVEVMKYYIKMQVIAVNTAKQQVEKARVRLNRAMQERKIHEKLKEKAFEEFLQELAIVERKELDELVSFKYHDTDSEDRKHGKEEKY